ncbi:hypothetical protein ACJ73_06896 [Blastomyces percursus]|uniref:Uncharacterized protein n=1 Tax=Blastomyces percursus TaxID=1658174 RepID=A0A1J9QZW4_9EURO|nr:hypothetical protein ACJ73_06896 [Blastomyces percursus]
MVRLLCRPSAIQQSERTGRRLSISGAISRAAVQIYIHILLDMLRRRC